MKLPLLLIHPFPHRLLLSLRLIAACLLIISPLHTAAQTSEESAQIARGYEYVLKNCAGCHSTEAEGESLHIDAPPFRLIGRLYPIDHLGEAFAEGAAVGHLDMPEFEILEPQQIEDLLAWMKSVQL